jgi:hypothetical protein
LYKHLVDNGFINAIESSNPELLDIYSRDVLAQIQNGGADWKESVPAAVSEQIVNERFFGYRGR